MKNENGLTLKQQNFIDNYLMTGNIAESAIKAGYSANGAYRQGNRLLRSVIVQNAISTRMKQLESSKIASQKEILEFLTAIVRGEHVDEVAMNIGKGQGITAAEKVQLRVSSKERIKAAELLAKINGLLVAKAEVDFKNAVPVIIKDDI